ncbi:hypothetical protein, partial [Helicobacter marmotae]|uniref:hypothetical protein n=1 Tax=Helicobacter marmotae TaxID=152490 RepID=UPI0011C08300
MIRIEILRLLKEAQNDNGMESTRNPSRDSSAQSLRHDNKSQTSFSSETRSHCDKIKSHEVPPLKASSGRGIYKGEGA